MKEGKKITERSFQLQGVYAVDVMDLFLEASQSKAMSPCKETSIIQRTSDH